MRPSLNQFISDQRLRAIIQQARDEDLGPQAVDVTSKALIPESMTATGVIRARQPGRLCGLALLQTVAQMYDPYLAVNCLLDDGDALVAGAAAAEIRGSLRSLLAMERVALNFITHLSGIATLTATFVEAISATRAQICDTRKTVPGLRHLEKYAVACGGGISHRRGLYDAVLIKDNHLTHLPTNQWQQAIRQAMAEARAADPELKFVEIEVDRLDQLSAALACEPDLVLLDNMTPTELAEAVALRDRIARPVKLEASGGVTLDNVARVAATGVDRIAIGALTHSAPALDLGMDVGPEG